MSSPQPNAPEKARTSQQCGHCVPRIRARVVSQRMAERAPQEGVQEEAAPARTRRSEGDIDELEKERKRMKKKTDAQRSALAHRCRC